MCSHMEDWYAYEALSRGRSESRTRALHLGSFPIEAKEGIQSPARRYYIDLESNVPGCSIVEQKEAERSGDGQIRNY